MSQDVEARTAGADQPTERELQHVRVAVAGSVGSITLNRAPVNQIDDAFLDQLLEALARCEAEGVSVVHIRSDREMFSAGADLRMVKARIDRPDGDHVMMATNRRFHEVYEQLSDFPGVTVAELNGYALGGGLELALACDLRVAAHEAKLGLPEVKVGLFPGAGGTQRLSVLCGPGIAARLILTGELLSGAEAQQLGLVQWAFPAADLPRETSSLVDRVAALPVGALRAAKVCLRRALMLQPEGLAAEILETGRLMSDAETRSRLMAFLTGNR
ncbi:enoyl-CoA hydratase/isomerase family protein [Phenylobacterium sp.]|jgi:enoyl-CoA hydratase/carnithine racemase|uniref:enoyl-CoA hydratase/isomerase family protein n=1 Tax=Phenylobacterium sp. TaxID=1871053 RepID=UPI002E333B04|nr:enoyl-CoA hydratase/isomerase family protein [Phenylobacterium sp.]HEX3364616.1 enoyl-CoA hydratase/isomerase family protein [Phenylobacterium sp.]